MEIRRITLSLTLILISIFQLHAQDAPKIKCAPNGDFVTFGGFHGELVFNNGDTLKLTNPSFQGYFLARFDSSGNALWSKKLDGQTDFCTGTCPGIGLAVDPLGNILVTGSFRDSMDVDSVNFQAPLGTSLAFLIKFDPNGNWLWGQTTALATSSKGVDITTDTAGNVYASGTFEGSSITLGNLPPTNTNGSSRGLYVVRLDPFGNGQWLQIVQGNGIHDIFPEVHSLAVSQDGQCYIGGTFGGTSGLAQLKFGGFTLDNQLNTWEVFMAKCSASGQPEWFKKIPGNNGYSTITDMVVNDSNQLFVSGDFGPLADFSGIPDLHSDVLDVFIARFDAAGNAIWAKQSDLNQNNEEHNSLGLSLSSSNTLFTVGRNQSQVEFPPLPELGTNGHFLVQMNTNGDGLCQSGIDIEVQDVYSDPFGNTYVVGGDPWTQPYPYNVTISKINDACQVLWDTEIVHLSSVGRDEQPGTIPFSAYPNPTHQNITIQFDRDIQEPSLVELFNLSGQRVYQQNLTPGVSSLELSLDSMTPGIYLLKVSNQLGVATKRIVRM